MRRMRAGAALIAAAASVAAHDPPKPSPSAREAADRFTLDLAPVAEDAAVSAPDSGTAPTLDTPIAAVIADPRGRRVLDRDLPGLSTDKNLAKFEALSLRRLAPMSGGRLTPELLAKVGADLAAAR